MIKHFLQKKLSLYDEQNAIEMGKTKFYVVWEGRETGIFNSWEECKRQVDGFVGAKYKSFSSMDLATNAFEGNYWESVEKKEVKRNFRNALNKPIFESISVDAACSGNPGKMEYRGVFTETGTELFKQGVFDEATNNIGEFLAIVHGLGYLKKHGLEYPLYSDSVSAISWVKAKKCKTKLAVCDKNRIVFGLIARAEKWLQENDYTTSILKWDTANWGEIPADFGRK